MKRFFVSVMIFFIFICFSALCIGADILENKEAAAYILMEPETKTVLDEKNSDMQLNAGFLSKLMSVLLVTERINSGELLMDEILTASESVKNTKGAVIWLEHGDKMSVGELLKSVIVGNANDAMTVLAERVSGDVQTFVMDMNARAFELGLKNTRFVSPYGYYSTEEHTSAYDIAVICSELSKYSILTDYFSIWRDFVKDGKVELVNENRLSAKYSMHIGFKASHSAESGYCIAEGGRNDSGKTFIAVSLGNDTDDAAYSNIKSLLKNGFNNYNVILTMFPDEMLVPLNVINGTETAVEIHIYEQGKAVVPRSNGDLKTKVVIPEYINAPVDIGQPIGCVAFYSGDTLVYEADIVTSKAVPALELQNVLNAMLTKLLE